MSRRSRGASGVQFEEFMRPYLDGIYGRAYSLTGSTPDAEDLMQEVCIRASSRFDDLVKHDNPRAWLMRVLYRLFVDLVRRRRRSPIKLMTVDGEQSLEAAASTDPGPEQQAEAATSYERLRLAWQRLTKDEQLLLSLHGIEGLSLAEIQEITGLPLGTIKSRLHRSRLRLGRLLRSADFASRADTSAGAVIEGADNAL